MARRFNFTIDQGTTFSTDLDMLDDDGVAIDLTGYTVNAIAKRYYTASNSWSFSANVANATAGTITLSLSANASAKIAANRYVYDVKVTDASNVVSRIIEGIITIYPRVS